MQDEIRNVAAPLDFLDQRIPCGRYVGMNEREARVLSRSGEVGVRAGNEIIDADHGRAVGQVSLDEVRADEPRGPGNQNNHRPHFRAKGWRPSAQHTCQMTMRFAACAYAAMLLTACGGGVMQQAGPKLPLAPQFALAGMPGIHAHHVKRRSWMLPDAKNIKKLLYVAGAITNTVYVYDYKTAALIGELTGFDQPSGECVDKKGDIWITNWEGGAVYEYAHGGTSPIRTLQSGTFQTACSIDPTSGNLAVGNFYGELDVWKHAKGTPTNYASNACPYIWGPGYDNQGNLFLEAVTSASPVFICELPHGGTALQIVPINWKISYGADVMWDGKYMTFADQAFGGRAVGAGVYQATESASGLSLAGSTALNDPCGYGYSDVVQPFILGRKNTPKNDRQGKVVIGSNNSCLTAVDFWAYPSGGNPKSVIRTPDDVVFGSVVSIK